MSPMLALNKNQYFFVKVSLFNAEVRLHATLSGLMEG